MMTEFNKVPKTAGQHGFGAPTASTVDATSTNNNSAVSWAAIFAGAVAATALSLLLLILGSGLGFSVISPWSMGGIGMTTFGFAAILWLTFTQIAASGLGGYLAGRLRTRWLATPTNEVYFRDTAHGFMTWALTFLLMVVLAASAVGSLVSGGARAGAEVASGMGSVAMSAQSGTHDQNSSLEYHIDAMFRSGASGTARQDGQDLDVPVMEVSRIFARSLSTGELQPSDQRYIGQLVAERTELNQQQAEQRVAQNFEQVQSSLNQFGTSARDTAEEARKASAYAALWMFIALSIGAFTASLLAVYGGRQRDLA